jgi:hypothetical protein
MCKQNICLGKGKYLSGAFIIQNGLKLGDALFLVLLNLFSYEQQCDL